MKLIPNYQVKLIEKNNKHFYMVDDEPTLYPGPTTVLGIINKPWLVPWASKITANKIKEFLIENATGRILNHQEISELIKRAKKAPEKIKDESADIGTRAHKAIDEIIKGNVPVIDGDIEFCVDGFIHWNRENSLTIINGDLKLASLNYGYGGSLDALAVDHDGKLVVIDFKTSNQTSEEYALQVASYCNALKEQFNLSYMPKGVIARFSKSKIEIEIRFIADINHSFECFKHALNLYVGMQINHYQSKEILKPKKRGNKDEANKKENGV